jgi:hypothetical protein
LANFGTYEGHKILSQAVNNSVDRVVKARQDKRAEERWQMEFNEKLKNDKVLREKAKWDFAKAKKSDAKSRLMVDIEKELYGDINTEDMFTVGPGGNIISNPNTTNILNNWENKSDYGHIRNITDRLLQSGDYGDVDLDYSRDISGISSSTADYAKSQLINIQKDLKGSGVTEDEFKAYLDNNSALKNAYNRYLIDVDGLWDESIAKSLYGQDPGEDDPVKKEMAMAEYFSDDGDYDGYQTIHNDTSTYGGGTYFKTNKTSLDDDDAEHKKILLDAIGTMRDWEVDQGNWWQLDDMWLEQRGDKWFLGEDDEGIFSVNDYFEVRVSESGTPQVKIGNSWENITGSSSKKW